jgi:hypothetical protein
MKTVLLGMIGDASTTQSRIIANRRRDQVEINLSQLRHLGKHPLWTRRPL